MMVYILTSIGLKLYKLFYLYYLILSAIVKSLFSYLDIFWHFFFPLKKDVIRHHVALVTGSAKGIGMELCLLLAKTGNTVVCLDRDEQENNKLVQRINRARDEWMEKRRNGANKDDVVPGLAFGYACDIAKRQEVSTVAQRVLSEVGDVTLIVNNAGVRHKKWIMEYTDEQIEATVNTNLTGQIWLLREFIPRILKQSLTQKCYIVSICALQGYVGFPDMAPFNASKHGAKGLMEGLFLEFKKRCPKSDVHFMIVNPFMVDTTKKLNKGMFYHYQPKEVAEIILRQLENRAHLVFIPRHTFYVQVALRLLPISVVLNLIQIVDTDIDVPMDHGHNPYD